MKKTLLALAVAAMATSTVASAANLVVFSPFSTLALTATIQATMMVQSSTPLVYL